MRTFFSRTIMQYTDDKILTDNQRSIVKRLLQEAESFIPQEISIEDLGDANFLRVVYIYFLTKYVRTLKAVYILIENDFGEDAFMLSRSLFEIWVRILWAEKHPEQCVLLFRVQFSRSMSKDVQRYRSVHGSPPPDDFDYVGQEDWSDESAKGFITQLANIAPELAARVRDNDSEYWPGKSLQRMVAEIDPTLKWFYGVGYSLPSTLLHADVGGMNHYILLEGTLGKPTVSPSGQFSSGTLCSSSGMLINILRIFDEKSNLRKKDKLDTLDEELTRAFGEQG